VKRPWSSECIAISKPWPSSPSRFSAGTSTFSKKSSPVEPGPDAELVLGVGRGHALPGALDDERAHPLVPGVGSVFATTSWWSATDAYEIQFFCPFRT
jgi:hypothetical protein